MSYPLTPAELQRAEILRAHEHDWKAERVGWIVALAVLGLAILGGFGGGPLAHASRASGAATLEFDRLVRHGAPTEFRIAVGPAAVRNGEFQVTLDWRYLRNMDFRDIQPAPIRSATRNGQLVLDFAASSGGTVVFDLEPNRAGRNSGRIGLSDGTALEFSQFVFP